MRKFLMSSTVVLAAAGLLAGIWAKDEVIDLLKHKSERQASYFASMMSQASDASTDEVAAEEYGRGKEYMKRNAISAAEFEQITADAMYHMLIRMGYRLGQDLHMAQVCGLDVPAVRQWMTNRLEAKSDLALSKKASALVDAEYAMEDAAKTDWGVVPTTLNCIRLKHASEGRPIDAVASNDETN